jgi:hypothetical protein
MDKATEPQPTATRTARRRRGSTKAKLAIHEERVLAPEVIKFQAQNSGLQLIQ